jgi:excisionase family DNA binding protein
MKRNPDTPPRPRVPREIPVLGLSVEEAAVALHLGRTNILALIEAGEIHPVRPKVCKTKIIISVEELNRYLRDSAA